MQSGVSRADPEPPPSVCTRLHTGSHSSDRKVRPSSARLHHQPPISLRPSFHSFVFFHRSSFTMSSILQDGAAHCAPASFYLPPHLPAHVLPLSTCPAPSLFNHLSSLPPLSAWDRASLPSFIKSFHFYSFIFDQKDDNAPLISTLLRSIRTKLSLQQNCV